jgi:SM-20-related protein
MTDGHGSHTLKVVNDFCDVSTLKTLFEGETWSYGWRSNASAKDSPFWHIQFCGGRSPKDKSFHDDILSAVPGLAAIHDIWQRIKEELAPGYGLIRVYANGHTYGLEGHIHRDCKPSENELTAIIYANEEWKDRWSGETVFFDESRECLSVRPRPGRLVLFDGSIPHVARAPTRDCHDLRITLVFKMRLKESG